MQDWPHKEQFDKLLWTFRTCKDLPILHSGVLGDNYNKANVLRGFAKVQHSSEADGLKKLVPTWGHGGGCV